MLQVHGRDYMLSRSLQFDWLIGCVVHSLSLPTLDSSHTDPFPALSVDQPLIDFDSQSQLMSASTSSPIDLLLSATAEQGQCHVSVCVQCHSSWFMLESARQKTN